MEWENNPVVSDPAAGNYDANYYAYQNPWAFDPYAQYQQPQQEQYDPQYYAYPQQQAWEQQYYSEQQAYSDQQAYWAQQQWLADQDYWQQQEYWRQQQYYLQQQQQSYIPPEPLWDEADDDAPPPRSGARRVLAIVANIAFFAVCIAMITAAIAFTMSDKPDKSFFGYRIYHVVSESMTPTVQNDGTIYKGFAKGGFYKGDAIIVRIAAPEKVRPGDVITIWTSEERDNSSPPLTHRVIELLPEYDGDQQLYFLTKGDHNPSNDPPIPAERLIGIKVFSVPKLGLILTFAKDHKAITAVVCVSTVVLIFLLFVLLSRKPNPERKKKNAPTTADPPPEPAPAPPPQPAYDYSYGYNAYDPNAAYYQQQY